MSTGLRLASSSTAAIPVAPRATARPHRPERKGVMMGAAWRLLVKASAVLDRSLEYEDTLQNIVRLAVPRIADYAAIALAADDGSMTWAASLHCDPGKEPLVGRLRGYRPRLGSTAKDIAHAPRPGTRLMREVTDELLRSMADDDAHLAMLRALGLTSVIILPLSAGNRTLGSLVLATTRESERIYTERDAVVASGVGRRAAAAVYRALLFRRAERAAHAREQVVGLVSHDLRNPLNTIMLGVDFLLEELVSRDAAHRFEREHIEAIGRAARTMNRLVGDLLDVTAIEAGQLRLNPAPVPVDLVIADALELLLPLAIDKRIAITAEVEPSLPTVAADRERLLQVFSNLGGNAIKFTPECGAVTVAACAGENCVEFVVRDSGPGIAADELPYIFEPFWQQRTTRRSGVGLGLAIGRAIVESHGGTLRVASEPGVGTTFSFTIPVVFDAGDAAADGEG